MNLTHSIDTSNPENYKNYQVVARKHRPQNFEALIGQGHISMALSNAINQSRIGHAYLFTGARGVGKTSSARIFAKCLNCVNGPTTTPCNQCDNCRAISEGEDVDVLEIDGASNRGIDEIRSLRSNVAIRPSRAKFKIYIIDEVHMLTMQAFNALLKTLEEPPQHVKFIFCTTDPQKIPITVLSRCQRFDFSPVQTEEIAGSLKQIIQSEGKTADHDAISLLARRANGSMRDSQSLLEQVFSFCGDHITLEEVHRLLGTADIGRVSEMATTMLDHDATRALSLLHQSLSEGKDPGQLASQLLGYFRDLLAFKLGCNAETLLTCSPSDMERLAELSNRIDIETALSILQVLDATLVRMQSSLHSRTLLEMAAIRICNLEQLEIISDLVKQLGEAPSSTTAVKPAASPPSTSTRDFTPPANEPKKKEVTKSEWAPALESASRPVESLRADERHPVPGEFAVPKILTEEIATVASNRLADENAASTVPVWSGISRANERQFSSSSANEFAPPTMETFESRSVADSSKVTGQNTELAFSESIPGSSPGAQSINLEAIWSGVVEKLLGMTADMVRDPETIELADNSLFRITLNDAYTVRECMKPERKQTIEAVLSEVQGSRMRVEFRASTSANNQRAAVPRQLPRAQQLRMLLEHEFVKQAMEVFSAEVTNFYPASKSKS
jgi:DNA polymerase III subunit gamma/tau